MLSNTNGQTPSNGDLFTNLPTIPQAVKQEDECTLYVSTPDSTDSYTYVEYKKTFHKFKTLAKALAFVAKTELKDNPAALTTSEPISDSLKEEHKESILALCQDPSLNTGISLNESRAKRKARQLNDAMFNHLSQAVNDYRSTKTTQAA